MEGGGRGENKNLRKISGVVEERGWWGWVNLPELGRGWGVKKKFRTVEIPVFGVFLLGINTPEVYDDLGSRAS